MKKNIVFTFFFSFIPGAGQMYQGYMKRGVSIMTLAGILVMLTAMFGNIVFLVPALVVCAYSFFDTYNIRNSEEKIEDSYAIDENIDLGVFVKNKKLVGGVLVIAGGFLLIDSVVIPFLVQLIPVHFVQSILRTIRYMLPNLLLGIAAVYIGLKMLGVKKEEK